MTPFFRAATDEDVTGMCALLNDIIEIGGTTAHQKPFDAARMQRHYLSPPRRISCVVAENQSLILGFQCLEWSDPDWSGPDKLPADWAIIASFVSPGLQGHGLGQGLFSMTRRAAKAAGVTAIDSTIRADNLAGLAYYTGLGFTDYGVFRDVPLRDGTRVDRIRKRLAP